MRRAKFWIDGITYNIGKDVENTNYFKTETNGGKTLTTFRLPTFIIRRYYEILQTDQKFHLSNMKKANSTQVLLPKNGSAGDVTIIGDSLTDVTEAREEFHSLIQKVRESLIPRQFIALPTLSQEIKDNFVKFKDELLGKHVSIANLEESIFQKAEKLHITACVFALLDKVEIDAAVKVLDELKIIIIALFNNKEVKIKLKGISCMDSNPKKANILYANASLLDETKDFNLQIIGDKIADFFYEKGFMKELHDSVKIHVTLINTKYRKCIGSPKKKRPRRIPIDARDILEEYKDFDFGVCNLDSIHLSLMSRGNSEDGFYEPLSIVKLI